MARQEQQKSLQRFQEGLEDLTFNSKPLIDDLTRAAGVSKSEAPKIVEMIESRIMQVARASGVKILSSVVDISCILHFLRMSFCVLYCLFYCYFLFGVTCDFNSVTSELATR